MSKEAMDAVQQNSAAIGGELAFLLIAAYHTFDKARPFHVTLGPQRMAELLHVSERTVRTYANTLIKSGELIWVKSETDGRSRNYLIDIPAAKVQEDPFRKIEEDPFRNYQSTGRPLPQDRGRPLPVSPDVAEVETQSSGSMALKLRKRSSAVPYKETYRETEEETEGGVQTIPRVREDGEPEPYTSAQIWSEIITHVREHRDDLNGYSAEEEEIQRWAKLFRHEAPGPYDLKLRGPADIAKSPRVRSMIRAAASQLYDARMQVDFQWW